MPALTLAPSSGPFRRAARSMAVPASLYVAALLVLTGLRGVEWIMPGELIWPISPDVFAAVIFLTVLAALLAAIRFISARTNPSRVDAAGRRRRGVADGLIAGPIVLLLALSAAARLLVQLVGFAGLQPVAVPVSFGVVGVVHSRSHATDHYSLRLRYGNGGRTFSKGVSELVYAAAKDGDTVVLPVETGRFGLQRAMVAMPIGVADLHHPG